MDDYLNQKQQACVQSGMSGLGIRSGAQIQMQAAMVAQNLGQSQSPRADTVRSLLDIAYEQLSALEGEISGLGEQLMPIRELSQTNESEGTGSALGEPEVIGLVRGLIGRLARQRSVVRSIANEIAHLALRTIT